jgi:putative membrane protein
MSIMKIFSTSVFVLILGAISSLAFAVDKIDAKDFIEELSATNIAEVESARLALEKSTSTDVKVFAQKMIIDHSAINMEISGIASRKKLNVSDEAEFPAKAKKFILEQRDGESFDEAYAKNQVSAHKSTIELFKRAAISDDMELAAFARQTLPKLQQHLELAKELAVAHDE